MPLIKASMTKMQRTIIHLTWMIETLKFYDDNARGGIKGIAQPYSEEMQDADKLLAELIIEEGK